VICVGGGGFSGQLGIVYGSVMKVPTLPRRRYSVVTRPGPAQVPAVQ